MKEKPVEKATSEQLAWAGRVWDLAVRRDCEALYWMCTGYHDGAEIFGSLPWCQIGEAIQNATALEMLRLEGYFVRAHR